MQRLQLEAFLDTLDEDVLDGIYSFIAHMSDSLFDEGVKGYVRLSSLPVQKFYRRNVRNQRPLLIGVCT